MSTVNRMSQGAAGPAQPGIVAWNKWQHSQGHWRPWGASPALLQEPGRAACPAPHRQSWVTVLTELQQAPLQSLFCSGHPCLRGKREQTHHKSISPHPGDILEINTLKCSQGLLEFPCSSLWPTGSTCTHTQTEEATTCCYSFSRWKAGIREEIVTSLSTAFFRGWLTKKATTFAKN